MKPESTRGPPIFPCLAAVMPACTQLGPHHDKAVADRAAAVPSVPPDALLIRDVILPRVRLVHAVRVVRVAVPRAADARTAAAGTACGATRSQSEPAR